ncbi:MAG: FHA domain-containing protein, partial [Myxococcales bacterium]|nr:FHA domain-containing protein [Myxococcales bacterium]
MVHRWRRRTIVVGRGEAADLQVSDPSLSGLHFELSLRGEHVWLRDMGSTNGTWVGDHRVGEVGLPPGSIFTAGSCEIQL